MVEYMLDSRVTVGVLALQGDYEAHRKMLEDRLRARTAFVRTVGELEGVDALVLPGGESTTIIKLMERVGLDTAIRTRIEAGMPVYGTCAGMILLARDIEGRPHQPTLKVMDLTVARNAFGRQIDSFEADVPFLPVTGGSDGNEIKEDKDGEEGKKAQEGKTCSSSSFVRGVFIRAPYITQAGPTVQSLGYFRDRMVAAQQGNLLVTAFHPELTSDPRVHAYFLKMIQTR